jgi:hypothetical protein
MHLLEGEIEQASCEVCALADQIQDFDRTIPTNNHRPPDGIRKPRRRPYRRQKHSATTHGGEE